MTTITRDFLLDIAFAWVSYSLERKMLGAPRPEALMARPCSICSNPKITDINDALDTNRTLLAIASEFSLKRGALGRHAKHRGGRAIAHAAIGLGLPSAASDKLAKELVKGQVASFRDVIRRTIAPGKVAKVLREGLEAKETKFFQKDGKVTDVRDVVAWGERRLYSELTLRAAGELQPESVGSPVAVKVEIVNIGGGSGNGQQE